MKRDISYTILQRLISMVLCLGIVLSSSAETDLFDIFSGLNIYAEAAGEMPDPDEYADQTLEAVWDKGINDTSNSSFWNASRPYYACAGGTGTTFQFWGGVYKRTIFHVFAFEGDTICIGSSVCNSGLQLDHSLKPDLTACGENADGYSAKHYPDEGSVDVVMTDLHGNNIPIDIRENDGKKTGYIGSPQAEYAAIKMKKQSDGTYSGTCGEVTYTPYTYKVTETGVYTFEFHSYDKSGATNPSGKLHRSDQWPTYETNYINLSGSTYQDIGGCIAALNLTVFDENGDKQTGRTYADYLSLQMGNVNQGVRDAYYILTTDSYIYKMQFNGASPYTYNFFVNNRGIYDDNGKIIYKSVKDIKNDNSFTRMGSLFRYPGTGDTDYFKSFYIFLEYPDPKLEGYLFEKAVPPDPAKNVRFVSTVEVENENVPGAYVGMGGYFEFDVDEATTATLRLEFKNTSKFGGKEYAPVEISTVVTPHTTNRVYWNGRDGNGEIIPVGEYSMEDIVFTVTTKAGEIHFPIIDMENANGGITFTRLSHIYDKDGKWLDKPGTIYDLTKNVIYYDETAIYYGEKVAEAGISEDQMTLALDTNKYPYLAEINDAVKDFFANVKTVENPTKTFWTYNNLISGGGEFKARTESGYLKETDANTIGTDKTVRVGDHSHTTNVIQYFDDYGNLLKKEEIADEQQKMIKYLDSAEYPVGMSPGGTGVKYINNNLKPSIYVKSNVSSAQTTTDYAIANYWTFIPAQPAVSPAGSTETIQIVDPEDENLFNLTGRVFYDSSTDDTAANANGKFDDGSESGEYLIPGVTLNLYKKTTDASYQADKTYVVYNDDNTLTPVTVGSFASCDKTKLYELVGTGQTTSDGIYTFTGLKYDKDEGTEYIYQVEKPSESYALTSATKGTPFVTQYNSTGIYYGYYADKSYDNNGKGTEIQHIQVGGTGGVDPTRYGYNNAEKTDENNVTVAAIDVGYTYVTMSKSLNVKKLWENGAKTQPTSVVYEISYSTTSSNDTPIYGYWMLSSAYGWSNEDLWLPAKQGSSTVDNYFVSAEYYIYCEDPSAIPPVYEMYKHTFSYDGSSGKYSSFVGEAYKLDNSSTYLTEGSINDVNGDEVKDAKDYGAIPSREWKLIDVEEAPFRAVLDRSDSSNKIDVNITNSAASGTVQIFKHFDDPFTSNALQGATFRIYEGDIDTIKGYVEAGDTAELAKRQVGSSTSRDNGLLAFPNLDPKKIYTVREMSPPGGYRTLQEYYQVVPKGATVKDEYKDYTVEFGNNVTIDNKEEIGEEGVAKLLIGNALADSNFFIRKRIIGRAWQDEDVDDDIPMDSFTFQIENHFEVATSGSLSSATGITVDNDEISLQTSPDGGGIAAGEGEPGLIEELKKFSEAVNKLNDASPVKIDYNSDYYTTDVTSGDLTYKISTDEKVSEGLIIAGDESTDAAFRQGDLAIKFPMAGTYTFTISEKPPEVQGTLQYSNRVYTVEITVTRKPDTGHATDPSITLDNSYLEAAVSKITYTDDGVSSAVLASNSPSFVNTYAPAPAKQETTYAISKKFTGRGTSKNEWLPADEFTINIEGVGSETQTAIQNNNLSIDGLKLYLNGEVNKWQYKFTENDTVPFTSFTFKDIEFPVEFVDSTTKEVVDWKPTYEDEQPPSNITAQTMPVEYWLRIYEDIPSDTNGITYDTTNYYLHIILRNTFKNQESTDSEEEDGIIDEIDMYLYKSEGQVTDLTTLTGPVATCLTAQQALNESEWKGDAPSDDKGGTFSWWYIDKAGKLQGPFENHETAVTTNADLLIRKWEKHVGDHTMPFSNEYKTDVYAWAPTVTKTLTGRDWDENDEFTFTIECNDKDNVEITNNEIKINHKTSGYTEKFDPINFKEPGEYVFTITEKHLGGDSITMENDGEYEITVIIEDDGEGHLKATFNEPYKSDTPINFNNVYTDTANSFKFDISKKIIGRNWNADDSFTFTITPDETTQEAIKNGLLTVPTTGWEKNTTGGYTAKLEGSEAGTSEDIDTSEDVFQKNLGEITAVKLPEGENEATYKFSITETAVANMKCREQTIYLTINVKRERDSGGVITGELEVTATYAYMGDTGTKTEGSLSGTDPKAVIPFVNVCMSSLTVEKEVVSTSGTDTKSFEFTVEFEFDESILNDERDITSSSAESITPTHVGNKWTFSLSDDQSVTFNDIPAYTKYTISETNSDKDYMFLRAVDESGAMLEMTTTGDTSSTEQITINVEKPPTVIFVNGRMINLPAAGGVGINTILLLGLIIAAAATGTLIVLRCKSGRSRDNPNG